MYLFEEETEDWASYSERLSSFFKANKVLEDLQVHKLISGMSAKMYQLLRSLVTPEKPGSKSLTEICAVLEKHLSPKPLLIAERYRFYVRNQAEGDSISEYVAALKKMSQNCEFGQFLQDALRDRLVCGLRNDHIQKRLLSEDKLTFEKALNLSVAMETAAKDTQELSKREVKQGVHKLAVAKGGSASSGKNPSSVGTSNSESSCWRCGRKHSPDQCWFKEEICRKCKTKGHIQRMCKKRKIQERGFTKVLKRRNEDFTI